jgi:hypothetical protein
VGFPLLILRVKLLLTRKLQIPDAAMRAKKPFRSRERAFSPAGIVVRNFTALHKKCSFVHRADSVDMWIIMLHSG